MIDMRKPRCRPALKHLGGEASALLRVGLLMNELNWLVRLLTLDADSASMTAAARIMFFEFPEHD
ncbi:hypothetical protein [Paraburkholderia haematera]|uniref:hypothetical protein n=1 Tax=Paraburkholderia haematera TaxID=2793077 RepID=UPI001B8AB40E|nr:hypothetical protein [Paraburkholderia haematera]